MPRRPRWARIRGEDNSYVDCAHEISATAPSRPVVWRSTDGQYCLQELIHPWHLVEETRALGHCVGRHGAGYRTDGRHLDSLTYWEYIESGQSRIYSFASQVGPTPGPLCTLHIEIPGHMLVEAGPKRPRVLTGAEPYFAALAASLDGLGNILGRRLRIDTGPSLYALHSWRKGCLTKASSRVVSDASEGGVSIVEDG